MEPRARFSGARLVINRNFALQWGGQAVSSSVMSTRRPLPASIRAAIGNHTSGVCPLYT